MKNKLENILSKTKKNASKISAAALVGASLAGAYNAKADVILRMESKYNNEQTRLVQPSQIFEVEVYAMNTDENDTVNVRWKLNYPTNDFESRGFVNPAPNPLGNGIYSRDVIIPQNGESLLAKYRLKVKPDAYISNSIVPNTLTFSNVEARDNQDDLQATVSKFYNICLVPNVHQAEQNPGILQEMNMIDSSGQKAPHLHLPASPNKYCIDASVDLENWVQIMENSNYNFVSGSWPPMNLVHTNSIEGIDPMTSSKVFYRRRMAPVQTP